MMNKLIRKKPEYIRKYDYIRYFYRPSDEWFYSTHNLENYIHNLIIKNITNNQLSNMNDFDLDYDESFDENEIDAYSFIDELKADNVDLDKNDPKVFEGNLIDQESKSCIKKHFTKYFKQNDIDKFEIIDFSELKLNNNEQFAKTIEFLKSNKYAIMFQPTFIARNKAIAKPDALINCNGKLILVETKGTTNPKFNHLVDIYYQDQIINVSLKDLDFYIDDYYLCIVKYELLGLKKISFVLTRNCSINKSGFSTELPESIRQSSLIVQTKYKANIREAQDKSSPKDTSIKSLLNNTPNLSDRSMNIYEKKYEIFFKDDDQFWKIIDELFNYQIDDSIPSLIPCDMYKSDIKDNDYWPTLQEYYYFLFDKKGVNKYPALQFSGKLIPYPIATWLCNDLQFKNLTNDQFIHKLFETDFKKKNALNKYLNGIYQNNQLLTYNVCPDILKHFNLLKFKKVYFDFESLNIATRVVDNYPPFMQVVNQVSIIFDHGDKNLKVIPYIVIDPINGITKNDFKKIIDAILPNNKDLDICNEYSYVVYNKSFECTRLKEMAKYINEDEYYQKVNVISNNIYDLADFFNLDSKNNNFQVIFKELKGFYSIKKVLPLVEKYDNNSFKIARCKNYKTELTQITNGTEAQSASVKRFFGLLNDQEWKTTVENLGKYCDNDVRAMVAVEYFIKNIIDNKIPR